MDRRQGSKGHATGFPIGGKNVSGIDTHRSHHHGPRYRPRPTLAQLGESHHYENHWCVHCRVRLGRVCVLMAETLADGEGIGPEDHAGGFVGSVHSLCHGHWCRHSWLFAHSRAVGSEPVKVLHEIVNVIHGWCL